MRFRTIGLNLLFLLFAAPAVARTAFLSSCDIPDVSGVARCGAYRVFETRDNRAGRTIDLRVVVLTATETPRHEDPLFIVQGGPGQGVSQLADFYARVFAQVRRTRDLVLIDLRGTGQSNQLECPQFGKPDSQGRFDADLLSASAVDACAAMLSEHADLRQYTTPTAMADLDEVRQALGYQRINIYGTSYGTYASLVYARLFPTRVRTLSLKGVVPPGQVAPLFHARDGERAWQRLVARCMAELDCNATYPSLDRDLRSILTRLSNQPEVLTVPQASGQTATISLSAGLFGEIVRNMLYTPEN